MKKTLFIIAALIFSFPLIAQNNPASDTTCPPVPWVNVEIQDDGNAALVSWDVPCDTCEVNRYRLISIKNFDPCVGETPADGIWHLMVSTSELSYLDDKWVAYDPGYYAYGIQAVYDTCESVWVYSDIIYYPMFNYYSLTVNVSLEDGGNPEGADISVEGATLCNDSLSYFEQSDSDGNALFEEVMYGEYKLTISKPGYQTALIENFIHFKDSTTLVELAIGTDPPPADFTVDAQNGMASWTLPAMRKNQNTPLSFRIHLADSLVAEPGPDENSYQFKSLLHDTEYTASISAIYDWGESKIASYTFVTNFVGINENMGIVKMDIFPNPTTNQLNIQSEEEILQIEVCNYLGQIILKKSVSGNQVIMNTSTLEAGIYIVRVETAATSVNRRLIVKH